MTMYTWRKYRIIWESGPKIMGEKSQNFMHIKLNKHKKWRIYKKKVAKSSLKIVGLKIQSHVF